ncbi:TPA: glutamine--fructose-6-phosphate transaminase (isomerizing) [Candidatus Acetothermia bacterium]|nr:glutamine--fructose-6-phosphate transaminase (isomerizing) [Candidatus Acetothermia bacterium]
MCGIIGYVGPRPAAPLLVEGLRHLEYRGYDSAGIATIEENSLKVVRRAGKIQALIAALGESDMYGQIGIGHSRWATHGKPTDSNAHPHLDCRKTIAVIHNGIIENYLPFKERLQAEGHHFSSQTDTEILAHLFERFYRGDLEEAVRLGLQGIKGAFAIAVIAADSPEEIIVAKTASPLVIGLGNGETFLSSDVPALLPHTRRMIFLHDGEMARLRKDSLKITDLAGKEIERQPVHIDWDPLTAQKGGFKHFMLKEIHEQAQTVSETIGGCSSWDNDRLRLDEFNLTEQQIKEIDNIYLVACGTSFHAGMIAKQLWEDFLPLPIGVEIGSEFRYGNSYIDEHTLVVAISQSGETADTLAGIKRAKEKRATVIAITNIVGSALERMSDGIVRTFSGPEIGVAATKTFTAQLAALTLLGLYLAQRRGSISLQEVRHQLTALSKIPSLIAQLLDREEEIVSIAEKFYNASDFLYLARGLLYPVALEGALKLKEISYIHAEGYPAGEMKHGPIALIDEQMPVVFLLSQQTAYDKVLANIEEVKARKGKIIIFTDTGDDHQLHRLAEDIFSLPSGERVTLPIRHTVPLQLLAYHIAILRGTDVDQPRNLAKTVTVE